MSAPTRAPRNRVRREDILAVAADLFASKGVAPTTVRDIGAAAGVHSGSLYHYFSSKDAIAAELLQTFVAELDDRFAAIAALPEPPLHRLRTMMRATVTFIAQHSQATRIFLTDYQYLQERGLLRGLRPQPGALRSHWTRVIQAGIDDGSLRADIPADVASRILRDALWATSSWPSSARADTDKLGDYLVEVFLHGLAG